jgi:peptidyl-prolyl cis-trans isomerase D
MFRFLKKNREAVKKYLLVFFLSVVSIGMVITLAPIPTGDTRRMENNTLAEIDGASITTVDLQRSIQSRLRGSPYQNDPKIISALAGGMLDDLVLQRALWRQAKKLGIEVSNQELLQSLQSLPWLYANGTFIGMDRYQDVIQQQTGMTVSQFEAQLREDLLQQKMRSVITDGITVSPDEVRQEYKRRNEKARIEYVLFDPSQYLKAVEVDTPKLEQFFNQEPQKYKVGEQRRVRYVLIDADHVRAGVKLDDAELQQYYSQHLADFRVQERVKVAHILFKTTGKSPAEVATAEKTARDVLAQLKSGADFAELAKKYSEDTTASNGGNLGWIVRGQTVKEFEDAAFSMKPGQVSDLIKTTYGIHILKVFDKQEAHLQTFNEVKQSIRTELEQQKIAAAQQAVANQFENQVKSNPKDFGAIARKLGLEPKQTDLFKYNQAIPDFGTSEAFANLAFQLRLNEVGTPISVPKGLAVIQLTEVVPEHTPKLEEVRAQVEEDYRAAQSKVLAAQKALDFATKVKNADFKKVAQASGLTVKESKDFTQQDSVEGLGSGSQLASAFTLHPGQTSDVISLPGDNRVVFRVVSRTAPDESGLASQKDEIREQLLSQKQALAYELYRTNLKQMLLKSGELKLNDSAMKQFLASYERTP